MLFVFLVLFTLFPGISWATTVIDPAVEEVNNLLETCTMLTDDIRRHFTLLQENNELFEADLLDFLALQLTDCFLIRHQSLKQYASFCDFRNKTCVKDVVPKLPEEILVILSKYTVKVLEMYYAKRSQIVTNAIKHQIREQNQRIIHLTELLANNTLNLHDYALGGQLWEAFIRTAFSPEIQLLITQRLSSLSLKLKAFLGFGFVVVVFRILSSCSQLLSISTFLACGLLLVDRVALAQFLGTLHLEPLHILFGVVALGVLLYLLTRTPTKDPADVPFRPSWATQISVEQFDKEARDVTTIELAKLTKFLAENNHKPTTLATVSL